MKCNKAQEWMSLEMDGRLTPEHVPLLQQHLTACGACRGYRDELLVSRRLLRATTPTLPESFDWKLQLRLNRALREAAGQASYPLTQPAATWRRWFARAGVSATLGLAAVLALALFLPSMVVAPPGGETVVASQQLTQRLPMQATPPAAPIFDTTRRPLDAGFTMNRNTGGLGLQQSVSSSGLGRTFWSGANERDLLRIRQLEQELEAMRRRLQARERQVMVLQARLDSLTAPAVDRTSND
jgi:hypothetical protein